MEERDAVDALFAGRPGVQPVLLGETSGKALYTDRPLEADTAAPVQK